MHSKPIDRRVTPRFRVQFRTLLSRSGRQEGIGILQDLSLVGCRLMSTVKVQRGLSLELRIHVPGQDWPLMIDTAQVQWIRGHTFGLAFLQINGTEQDRLSHVMTELVNDTASEQIHEQCVLAQ